jgi:predicted RNase H-like nuclease (RuvC/YqgF family)
MTTSNNAPVRIRNLLDIITEFDENQTKLETKLKDIIEKYEEVKSEFNYSEQYKIIIEKHKTVMDRSIESLNKVLLEIQKIKDENVTTVLAPEIPKMDALNNLCTDLITRIKDSVMNLAVIN